MKSKLTLILITVGTLILSGCNTGANSVTRIILDFPHGALRLHVQRDGDTRLFYGALLAHRMVKSDTFDIDELFQQLQTRLHDVLPAEDRPIGQSYGMVTLEFSDGSERDYLIYDRDFVEALFKTACANSMDDGDSANKIIAAECARLGDTSP